MSPAFFFFFKERKLMKTMFMCSKAQRKFITLRNSTLHKWNESNLIYDRKGPSLDWTPPHLGQCIEKTLGAPGPAPNGGLADNKHICSSVFENRQSPRTQPRNREETIQNGPFFLHSFQYFPETLCYSISKRHFLKSLVHDIHQVLACKCSYASFMA